MQKYALNHNNMGIGFANLGNSRSFRRENQFEFTSSCQNTKKKGKNIFQERKDYQLKNFSWKKFYNTK